MTGNEYQKKAERTRNAPALNPVPFVLLGCMIVSIALFFVFRARYAQNQSALNFWRLFLSAAVASELVIFHLVPPFAALITFLITRKDGWHNRLWLRPFRGEREFYKAIRLKQWKDRAATWSTGLFATKDISQERLAINMTQSEIVHELIFLLSFLSLLLARRFGHLPLLAVLCAVFAAANLPFVFIQRYNRPRVMQSQRLSQKS